MQHNMILKFILQNQSFLFVEFFYIIKCRCLFFLLKSLSICNWFYISVMTDVTEYITRIHYFFLCHVENHFNHKQRNWFGWIWMCSHGLIINYIKVVKEIEVIAVVTDYLYISVNCIKYKKAILILEQNHFDGVKPIYYDKLNLLY